MSSGASGDVVSLAGAAQDFSSEALPSLLFVVVSFWGPSILVGAAEAVFSSASKSACCFSAFCAAKTSALYGLHAESYRNLARVIQTGHLMNEDCLYHECKIWQREHE